MRSATLSLVFASAALAQLAAMPQKIGPAVFRRQAFNPGETTGSGDNCVDAFGAGYVECRPASDTQDMLCINPSIGETCCENLWGCPSGSFCLVDPYCCPDGEDPTTCAVQNSVSLPPNFATSTSPPISESTSASASAPATTTSAPAFTAPSSNYTSPTTTTGPIQVNGASRESFGAGVAVAVLGFAGLLL